MRLEYPQSLAVYDDYAAAQKAVDFLSDEKFPVEQLMIVGTDLKRIERITGRLTTRRVAAGRPAPVYRLGLFVGLLLSLFSDGGESTLAIILATLLFGALFGMIFALRGLRPHPGPARLLLGHRGGGHEVRGAGRAQVRGPGPRAARQAARRPARPVRVEAADVIRGGRSCGQPV